MTNEVTNLVNELFNKTGLLPKQYVDLARIKAARVQRNKDFALTKAEKAVIRQIERTIVKKETQQAKYCTPPEPVEVVVEPTPKKKTTRKRKVAVKKETTND